jgi:hypothetical protein
MVHVEVDGFDDRDKEKGSGVHGVDDEKAEDKKLKERGKRAFEGLGRGRRRGGGLPT